MRSSWTEQDDARLRELLEQGLSYWEVGEAMGRSKNSCIGRGHRLGLMTRTDPAVIDAKRARWSRKKPELPKKEQQMAVVIPFPDDALFFVVRDFDGVRALAFPAAHEIADQQVAVLELLKA